LQLDLYFERFLNPARSTPPDIDTDLCSIQRDEVIKHVFQKYGYDRVAMVATISRFRPRSALGDTARAHGFSQEIIRKMVKNLPYSYWERNDSAANNEKGISPFDELRRIYSTHDHLSAINEAEALLLLPRHLSLHPGGLIVAPGNLTDLVPVMRSSDRDILVTQMDLDSIEAFGLVKIDLLGIRGLSVLGDIAKNIPENGQPQIGKFHSVLHTIPSEDPETSERVLNGQTIGCFQIESPGMRATLREIHAKTEIDIMAALALYRPGPLSGGLKDAFVRRHKGLEKVEHIHPTLAPLLDETFGVILYQEQVLRIAHDVAGFSLAEADLLRRGMSHFDPGKKMQELKNRFIEQSGIRSNISTETSERIWEMMAAFAGYGFPKAHAASYAKVAWRSAWCKTHFPAEFLASVLSHGGGYYSQRVFINEARRLGIPVKPPSINFSKINVTVRNDGTYQVIYLGLNQVKDLTRRTMANIMQMRPFSSIDEFLQKVDPRITEAENMAKIGAFDGFGTIPDALNHIQHGWMEGQLNLFSISENIAPDWTVEQKMSAQLEILGIGLEVNPLEMFQKQIESTHAVSTVEAAGKIGQRVSIVGLRQTSHQSRTKKGEKMLFLSMEDLTGSMDVILFPKVFEQARTIISSTTPFLVFGIMEFDPELGEPFLNAEKISRLT
ncbi:MAG: DNA polymerase III subunit alpha, partial [Chloroflexota bacterium]